jgi:hypothetical protein
MMKSVRPDSAKLIQESIALIEKKKVKRCVE